MAVAIGLNVGYACVNFKQMNEMETYRLDGQQQAYLSMGLMGRCQILDAQVLSTGYKAPFYFGTVGTIIFFVKNTMPFIKMGWEFAVSKEYVRDIPQIATCINSIDQGLNTFLDYSAPVMNVICIASYVAMIVFGHPIIGGIGLAGLLLVAIKQYGFLPDIIDQIITPFSFAAMIYVYLVSPINIVLKGISLIACGIMTVNYLSKKDWIGDPRVGNHVITKPVDLKNAKQMLSQNFTVNRTSVHAQKVGDCLSLEDMQELKTLDVSKLYNELEKRCAKLQIKLGAGWEEVKRVIRDNGGVKDARPVRLEKTKEFVKMMFSRALQDEDDGNFKLMIEELNATGVACNEGWLRDTAININPRSTDYKWAIHHQLARIRGVMIKEVIDEGLHFIDQESGERKILNFDHVGGSNNAHLMNQINAALWHRWRSFEGEVFNSVQGRGLLMKWLQRDNDLNQFYFDEGSFSHNAVNSMISALSIVLPIVGAGGGGAVALGIDFQLRSKYNADRLIKALEVAIEKREIQWEAIVGWLISLHDRGFPIMDEEDNYDPTLVQDLRKPYSLTQRGIKLLLWDLGVIEPDDQEFDWMN